MKMILFWQYTKKYKGLILLALILATINQLFSLLDPQILRLLLKELAFYFLHLLELLLYPD